MVQLEKRITVEKTHKLFIGGQLVRSESGRYLSVGLRGGKGKINLARASRKDLRNAVEVARHALTGWKSMTAYLRGQILYRVAEMMEARRDEMLMRLTECVAQPRRKLQQEFSSAVDHVVWYAGWADKYASVMGSINPVAGPFFVFSYPEPIGVVGIVAPKSSAFAGLIQSMMVALVSGNTCVVVARPQWGSVAITLAEILATSDVPSGVVNVITGDIAELVPHMYTHMDINAVLHPDAQSDLSLDMRRKLLDPKHHNLKRFPKISGRSLHAWTDEKLGPLDIGKLTELKTVWHPAAMP